MAPPNPSEASVSTQNTTNSGCWRGCKFALIGFGAILIVAMVIGALLGQLEFGYSGPSTQPTDQASTARIPIKKTVGPTITKINTVVRNITPTPSSTLYTGNGDATFYYTVKESGRHTFHMQYGPGTFILQYSYGKDHEGRPYMEGIRVESGPSNGINSKWEYLFIGEGVFYLTADGPWTIEIQPND